MGLGACWLRVENFVSPCVRFLLFGCCVLAVSAWAFQLSLPDHFPWPSSGLNFDTHSEELEVKTVP